MKAKTILAGTALFLSFISISITAKAQATNAELQQAVAAYQQSPTDETTTAVIKVAASMRSLPPVPEEARKHFVRGSTLFKSAKSPEDYGQVIDEFREAVHLAPWWPEARYNWSLAFEAAGSYAPAIENLKFYLLFKLPEADARSAQDKIYALEIMQEQAAKAKAEADAAAVERQRAQEQAQQSEQEEKSFEEWFQGLNGRRYGGPPSDIGVYWFSEVRGKTIVNGVFCPYSYYDTTLRRKVMTDPSLAGDREVVREEIAGHSRNPDGSISLTTRIIWTKDDGAQNKEGGTYLISADGITLTSGNTIYRLR
jgi:hypothetical protein